MVNRKKLAVSVFVVVLIGLAVLYLSARLREQARMQYVCNILQENWQHLYNYQMSNERLPPESTLYDGREECSWRFQVMPYTYYGGCSVSRMDEVTRDFALPWKEGFLRAQRPDFYCLTDRTSSQGFGATNVLAIVGPGTAFDSGKIDRETHCILLMITGDTDIAWGDPGDIEIDETGHVVGKIPKPFDDKWYCILFSDGRTWILDRDVPAEKLEIFFSVDSSSTHDPEDVLGQYVRHRRD